MTTCSGITARPLDVKQVSLEAARQVVPDSLYWLIRFLVTGEAGKTNCPSQCSNTSNERQILSICQDIIHCSTNGRVKTPKHAGLAITVHHLTSSRRLITLLNKMGHCSSYDEMRAIDTSAALEVLAKANEFGTVIPSNISPGPFIQIAADNNDLNEETLDGKNTTHATTMVVYQRKAFGPDLPPAPLVDHTTKRRSLQSTSSIYDIQECYAHGRRPAVSAYVNQVENKWFEDGKECFIDASRSDEVWRLMRLHPSSLQQASEPGDNQPVPGWSGFNAILFPEMAYESNIGYCPMMDRNSNEYSTIYTVLKHAQKLTSALGQQDTVVTFDLLIYMKAKQIQWRYPEEFANVIIRMGGFHIALNYLGLIGKKYLDSGLDDLLIESGVYAAGTTAALMKGKSYNRGVRAHKLVSEAMFRLMWSAFVEWYASADDVSLNEEERVLQCISDGIHALQQDQGNVSETVAQLGDDLRELSTLFKTFKEKTRAASKTFLFWEQYIEMVDILLQFIKAERSGNWDLYLSALAEMTPHFFAMDRPNYARWLPVYIADMNMLESSHPKVHEEFLAGNFSVSRSGHPFSQVSTDMALEQSINADSKSKGGIVGMSQSPAALERWFLTAHERTSVTTALKEMYGDNENHQVGAILWRINMLYPIMALIVDLDCDLVGIAVFIRISG